MEHFQLLTVSPEVFPSCRLELVAYVMDKILEYTYAKMAKVKMIHLHYLIKLPNTAVLI
jgi:hypothetical protein